MNEDILQELLRKYSDQSLSKEEERIFFSLLEHPRYKEQVEAELLRWWNDTAPLEALPLTSDGKKRIAAVMEKLVVPERKSERKSTLIWRVAASIILVFGIGVFCFLNDQPPIPKKVVLQKKEIKTNYGEKKTITMPDGTKVFLNAGSVLRYDSRYNTDLRRVELVGEAFFEVTKDESKPFLVRSQQLDTYVLGTSFNVRAFEGDENLYIALISGAVKVEDGKQTSFLKAGEKMIYHTTTAESEVLEMGHNDHWGDWRKEILSFNSESFAMIVVTLEKWYGVQIQVENKGLMKQRFTGEFHNLPINKVLDLLRKGYPFSYRMEEDQIYIK